jgi:hypothetical protein
MDAVAIGSSWLSAALQQPRLSATGIRLRPDGREVCALLSSVPAAVHGRIRGTPDLDADRRSRVDRKRDVHNDDAIFIEMSHAAATHLRASKRFVFVLQRLGGGIAYRARCEARLGAAPLCLLSD